MRFGRASRQGTLAVAVSVAALVLPASAAADTFRGETAQGKPVTLEARPDGDVRKVVWRWSTTDCEDPDLRLKTQSTVLKNPPGRARTFSSRGSYTVEYSDATIRFKVISAGRRREFDRWSGTFKAKAMVDLEDGDEVLCKLRRIDWSARLKP